MLGKSRCDILGESMAERVGDLGERVGELGERVGDGFFSNIFLNLELGGEIEISRAVGLCEAICRVEYDAKRMRTGDELKTQEC